MQNDQSGPKRLEDYLGDSSMAKAIAAFDWATTTLGPVDGWPPALRAAVATICRAPVGMALLWGPRGALLYNDGYDAILGGRRNALGQSALDVWPEAAEFNAKVIATALAGGSSKFLGQRFTLDRGAGPADCWFDLFYTPLVSGDGVPVGAVAITIETTDQMAATRQVAEERERFAALFDQAPTFMAMLRGPDHRFEMANPGYTRLVGRDVVGKTVAEGLPEAAEQGFVQLLDTVYRTGEPFKGTGLKIALQATATAPAGDRYVDFVYQPIRDGGGAVAGIFVEGADVTDRVVATEKLRESEARLRRAQEAGGVGAFSLDVVANRVSGTPEFYRIFGLPDAESYPAETFEGLVASEDAAARSDAARRADRTAPLDVEYRIRRADDGALRWISRRAEFTEGPGGSGARMDGVAQDVTDRVLARRAAEGSAAQFKLLAESLPNQVWTSDAAGMLDWFNRRVYEYSGAEPGELDGQLWTALVHPDDVGEAGERWSAALSSGAVYETEFRLRRADGAYRWHLARALPIASDSGGPMRWIGTNTDIHEGKLAQVESDRDRERIWALSQELMLVSDFTGVILDVNPAAARILGWPRDAMVGLPFADFIHPDDAPATAREVGKLASGVTTLAFENRYRRLDGAYRLLSWTAVPDDGRIHGVARDVTRERAAEDALRQSQKLDAIGQLTGGVAHDFNNMLGVIQISTDLLRRLPPGDPRAERSMRSISSAVDQAKKLTGQLLSFARRQNLQPEVFDAGANARGVGEMIESLAGARVDVEMRLPPEPCYVKADPSQFATSLVNLAVNARDAMPDGGRIVIQVRAEAEIPAREGQAASPGSFVAISVADAGVGIPAERLGQIFEPFFTTKPVGMGTGLGLSQVFGFAKQSGGDIHAKSAVGRGSVFTLYLPSAENAADPAPAKARPQEHRAGRRARVLVVEDNVELAVAVELMLAELGYDVVAAASADEALAALRQRGAFDALFSDIMMAGMGGLELAERAREIYPELPILLATGYSAELSRAGARAFPVLPKPYALADLAAALHKAIKDPGDAKTRAG